MGTGRYRGSFDADGWRRRRRTGWLLLALLAALMVGRPDAGAEAAEPLASSAAAASAALPSSEASAGATPSVSLSVLPEMQTVQLLIIDAPTTVSAYLTIRLSVLDGPVENVGVEAFVPRALGTVQTTPRADLGFGPGGTTVSWALPSVADGDELQITTYADAVTSSEGDYLVTARITQGPCAGEGCLGQGMVSVVWYTPPVYVLDLAANPAQVVPPAKVAFSIRLNCMMPGGQLLAVQARLPDPLGAPAAISGGGTYDASTHTISWRQFACLATESFEVDIGTDVAPGTYTVAGTLPDACSGCPAAQTTVTVAAAPPATPTPTPTIDPAPTPTKAATSPRPTLPATDTDPGVGTRP